ncbi:MAG TPA: hypothetical protein VMB72_10410 [Acidimicrobiales bacterium]|nr:hypothetical protein [Acidimicrobiales bacterium]
MMRFMSIPSPEVLRSGCFWPDSPVRETPNVNGADGVTFPAPANSLREVTPE